MGGMYAKRQGFSEYLKLREVNEELAAENALLKSRQLSSFTKLQDDLVIVNDTILKQRFEYISAKVINASLNAKSNFITINRGSEHGIGAEMGVICNNSIVGIVKDVSRHYSTVVPVINPGFQASVKLKKSGEQGILMWSGSSVLEATVTDLPPHAKLTPGDTLVTTGYSAYFPAEVMIGTVLRSEIRSGDNLNTATVHLSTNFYSVSYVEVIINKMKFEQKELEALMEE